MSGKNNVNKMLVNENDCSAIIDLNCRIALCDYSVYTLSDV